RDSAARIGPQIPLPRLARTAPTVRRGLALAQPPIPLPGIPRTVRLARPTGIAPTRHGLTTATVVTLRLATIPLRVATRLPTALRLLILPAEVALIAVEVVLIAVAAAHMAAEADPTAVAVIAECTCLISPKLR